LIGLLDVPNLLPFSDAYRDALFILECMNWWFGLLFTASAYVYRLFACCIFLGGRRYLIPISITRGTFVRSVNVSAALFGYRKDIVNRQIDKQTSHIDPYFNRENFQKREQRHK
jgi:hypothetical protein